MASSLFEDFIVYDEFTTNEIPFTVIEMLNEAEGDQVQYWNQMSDSQLTSTYATLGDTADLPSRDSVMHATRYNPLT